jgi:hypothetical protein
MVRTYWLVPVFYEASGNLDLQPFRTIDHVEACRPRAMYATNGSRGRLDRVDPPHLASYPRIARVTRQRCGVPRSGWRGAALD